MISVVICSVDEARFSAVAENYARVLRDEPYEMIRISDAKSLCEGYARGFQQSRGEQIIFCHDDIEILSPDFAERLKEHLNHFDLIGVAGTNRLVRGEWVAAGPPYIFGQVAQTHPQHGFVARIFGVGRRIFGGIHAMDGLFLAARRSVVEKVGFDAQTFDGFHHYDLDFTFSAHRAGFRLAVVCDIHIIHHSWSEHDDAWRRYAALFEKKHAGQLHPMPPRKFALAAVCLGTRDEVAEVLRGGYSQ